MSMLGVIIFVIVVIWAIVATYFATRGPSVDEIQESLRTEVDYDIKIRKYNEALYKLLDDILVESENAERDKDYERLTKLTGRIEMLRQILQMSARAFYNRDI